MDFTSQIPTVGSRPDEVSGRTDADTAVAPSRRWRAGAAPATPPDPAPQETGPLLDGRYALSELLGQGGSAAVYRGTDLRLCRPVAVKIFHANATEPTTAARQRAEMLFLARLNHPNLVAIYDARVMTIPTGGSGSDHHDGAQSSYLVMEFVAGTSLAQRLAGATMTLEESAAVGIGMANALRAVHNHGLVHRDVKPANVLLPAAGGAKLADFGIARLLDSAHLTITAEIVGTPMYLSPEQATGRDVGPGTDIYSLGLVLLECVTGRPEFPGGPVQSMMVRLLRDPHVPLTLPGPWPDLLRAMTNPDPAKRPTTEAVAETLTTYLQDRHQSRTATTITATATQSGPAQNKPALHHQHRPAQGAPVAAAPPIPHRRIVRVLPVITGGLALAVMTATIALITPGDADHPAGQVTTHNTTTPGATTPSTTSHHSTARSVLAAAPARSAARSTTLATTYAADWNPAHAVTVITTATTTATETTTITTGDTTATPPTITSGSTTPTTTLPTTPSESAPASTTPSETTTPTTTPSDSTPPTTTTESPTGSTTPPAPAVP